MLLTDRYVIYIQNLEAKIKIQKRIITYLKTNFRKVEYEAGFFYVILDNTDIFSINFIFEEKKVIIQVMLENESYKLKKEINNFKFYLNKIKTQLKWIQD